MNKIILSSLAVVALALMSGCATEPTSRTTTTSQQTTVPGPTTTTTTNTETK